MLLLTRSIFFILASLFICFIFLGYMIKAWGLRVIRTDNERYAEEQRQKAARKQQKRKKPAKAKPTAVQ